VNQSTTRHYGSEFVSDSAAIQRIRDDFRSNPKVPRYFAYWKNLHSGSGSMSAFNAKAFTVPFPHM